MRQLLVLYSTFLLAALGGLAPCSADNSLPLVAVLTPQATGQVSNFGAHIDIDGDRAFIGASQGGFIYRRPTTLGALWMQEQYVNAGAFTFGSSVALRGNVALMGDSGLGTAAQQAGGGRFWMREGADSPYQFAQTVWPADAASHDQFGSSVALGEGFAFIGAENDSHHGKVSTGTATLYEQNSAGRYVEVKKFAPADLFGGSDFGGSLDLDGDRLVVGASGNGAGQGAAYVYERNAGGANQWGQVAKLEFPGRFYGEDVAVDNDTILVSRPGYDMTAGSVDVYDRDSQTGEWMRTARLFDPASEPQYGYGRVVALSGDLAVIGSGNNVDDGEAFVYSRHQGGQDNWGWLATLTSPVPGEDPWFGSSAAIMGNLVLIGSLGIQTTPGAVYVFAIPEPSALALSWCVVMTVAILRRTAG